MTTSNSLSLSRCIHGAKGSPCNAACPFQMDIRAIIEKVKAGNFSSAYGLYRESVLFPGLAWQLCPAPCKKVCHQELGSEAIDIPKLERSLFENSRNRLPVNYNSAKKNQRVAILGATLRGMSAALKLAQAGYPVTVFEKNDRICNHLETILDRSYFEEAILSQFRFAVCEYCFQTDLEKVNIEDYTAVLIADSSLPAFKDEHVFYMPEPPHVILQIPQGKQGAKAVEWFLTTGNRKNKEILWVIPESMDLECSKPAEVPEFYTKAEARQAAGACSGCDCSACLEQCVLLRDYGYGVKDLSRAVGLSLNLFKHAEKREGTRQIGGCNNCGLCEKICPENINIGQVLLSARTELFAQGDIPPAYHDFWVRDMSFADSEYASLFYLPPEESGKFLFFPGCQIGASDPRYVSMIYERLLSQYPGTSILLRCCGAPLLWAGDAEGAAAVHKDICECWEQAGRPVVLTACPSCYRIFHESMPEIPVQMIYEVMDHAVLGKSDFGTAAVFDPCASRYYPELQRTVRDIAADCGVKLEELKYHGETAQCCSWGGHAYCVNRKVVDQQAKEQIEMSSLPYITYCTNCHDIFVARGKECRHILDLILGINPEGRDVPDLRTRRCNRNHLKKQLVQRYQIPLQVPDMENVLELHMTDMVRRRLNQELIMTDDISSAIRSGEETGFYLLDGENGHRMTHRKRGLITYWVEYTPMGDGSYTVYNAYSHRMSIKNDVVAAEIGELRDETSFNLDRE